MNNETRDTENGSTLLFCPAAWQKALPPHSSSLVVNLNVFNFNFFIVKIPVTNEKLLTAALKRNTYDKPF